MAKRMKWSTGLMPCGVAAKSFSQGTGRDQTPVPLPSCRTSDCSKTRSRNRRENRQRFELHPGRRRIVFSARLMQRSDPIWRLGIRGDCDERPEWDLLIVGDGELRAGLEKQVPTRLRNRIVWTGFLHDVRKLPSISVL